jgi:uncharacterized membrane protein YuzA (DUF378 family)
MASIDDIDSDDLLNIIAGFGGFLFAFNGATGTSLLPTILNIIPGVGSGATEMVYLVIGLVSLYQAWSVRKIAAKYNLER